VTRPEHATSRVAASVTARTPRRLFGAAPEEELLQVRERRPQTGDE
jgi:hypothetical protein